MGAGGRSGALEHLFAVHDYLDRPAGLPSQDSDNGFQVSSDLGAEPATDLGRYNLDRRLGYAQHGGAGRADSEGPLSTGPNGDPAIGCPNSGGGMGLDVTLVHRLGFELPLHDYVGLGEPLFYVAQLVLNVARHVALNTGIIPSAEPLHFEHSGQVFVEQGRIGLEGVVEGEDRGKNFVVHLDQAHGLFRDVRVGRRHRRQSVAFVQYLVVGHHVLRHQADVALGLRQVHDLVFNNGKVLGGSNSKHPRQGLGFAGINGPDAGMSMGAAQDLAVQHPRQLSIRTVLRRAGHLLQTVVADGPGANYLVLG